MKLHIDFDSFFANAEIARRPELTDLPVVVYAGLEDNPIILAATYDAKALGIYTTQRLSAAYKLSDKLCAIKADLPYYKQLSKSAYELFCYEMPIVEQYSIDEFFADLSGFIKDEDLADFARYLQELCLSKLRLKASIGISKSKWSAKFLTNLAKPFGIKISHNIQQELKGVDIKKFPGIGKVLERKLRAHGISSLDQALKASWLFSSLNEQKLYKRILGEDNEAICAKSQQKALGASKSFKATSDLTQLLAICANLADELNTALLVRKLNPNTLSLGYKAHHGAKSYRIKLSLPFNLSQVRKEAAKLAKCAHLQAPVYHLELSASDFLNTWTQDLFNAQNALKQQKLNEVLAKYPQLIKQTRT